MPGNSMTFYEALMEGATATVIGMGMVFGVLAILCGVLYLFKYLTPTEKVKAVEKEIDTEPIAEDEEVAAEELSDDSELVAVISAALASYMAEGAPAAVIRSIKQVNPGGGTYRAWNSAAVRENHRGVY